jgi:hypothetical protein
MIDQDITAGRVQTEHGWGFFPGNATREQVAELVADEAEPEAQ